MTIILYCSLPPILRLRITNIFGRTSLIRCIMKKCLCSIVVIFGRWPALLLLGYLCTHTDSHFLRHCRARIMLLYIERTTVCYWTWTRLIHIPSYGPDCKQQLETSPSQWKQFFAPGFQINDFVGSERLRKTYWQYKPWYEQTQRMAN
jgi:hypothetical protein